jgi:Protein of unknown function (DUF3617)
MRSPLLVASLLLLAALPAVAQDYPKLKPGLWEMTNSNLRRPGESSKMTLCLDNSIQQDMLKMSSGLMAGMCSKTEMKSSGNKFTGEAICNIGGSTMKSKSVMTLNGDTSYRTEAHATFDPPLGGAATTDTVIEGKHVGACKPGQQPGDITMPTGQTVNIRSMMNDKASAKK